VGAGKGGEWRGVDEREGGAVPALQFKEFNLCLNAVKLP